LKRPRLALALLLFLPALLAVVPPGLNAFWKLSIVVKEAGMLMVLPCLLLACWSAARWKGSAAPDRLSAITVGLGLAAALLYASPLARAVTTARDLESEFDQGFGKIPPSPALPLRRSAPLIWKDFFRGVPTSPVKPRTWVYKHAEDRVTGGLSLDFYPAIGRDRAPCVLVIHGGGWDSGDRGQLPDLNGWLAAAGYSVASIDYRLAPKQVFPAPVEDVADAIAFLKKSAHVDTTRFILLGRSAGGQIALQAAYTLRDPAIRGVIAYYAPADMVFGYSLPGNPLILDSRTVMDQYLGGSCHADPERCRASSPLEFADANSPPTLLLHGGADVMVSPLHTVHLNEKLAALGVPHFSVQLPWATHGYDYVFSGPGSQISLYFVERFLSRILP
jgi:acetyl esterase/lipase